MFGITIRTRSAAGPFWELVDKASALESAPTIRALGYPPHITLTRYSQIAAFQLAAALQAFEGEAAFSLTFDRMATFDTAPLVLWLSPQHDRRLIAAHAKVHAIIDPMLCDANYQPQRWNPHLTVAMSIPAAHRAEARELAALPFEPFSLTFDVVDCVSWPPVAILHTYQL